MKTCTHCGKTKTLDKFRKNKKSKDKVFSVCKQCLWSYKEETRQAPETVIEDMWFDILEANYSEVIKQPMYFNKKGFILWVKSNPVFNIRYKEWLSYKYNTKRLSIKLTKDDRDYSLENLTMFIKDLEPNENLRTMRVHNYKS